jgi:hypothetical protein
MKYQPKTDYKSNDCVMTPDWLSDQIVKHFCPTGRVLEPCSGDGSFVRALSRAPMVKSVDEMEITRGQDFLSVEIGHYDWIVTNPPWSRIREFLPRCMEVSDNVVLLLTINHLWTKSRIRMIEEAGFSIQEIILIDTPKEFPQSGFQLGAVWLRKGSHGDIHLSRMVGKEVDNPLSQ